MHRQTVIRHCHLSIAFSVSVHSMWHTLCLACPSGPGQQELNKTNLAFCSTVACTPLQCEKWCTQEVVQIIKINTGIQYAFVLVSYNHNEYDFSWHHLCLIFSLYFAMSDSFYAFLLWCKKQNALCGDDILPSIHLSVQPSAHLTLCHWLNGLSDLHEIRYRSAVQ